MKLINYILYSILFFNFSNSISMRDPFQFKQQEQSHHHPIGPKYKVIGYGKSGDGTKFVIVDNGQGTETITQKDPNWVLYSNF